MGDRDLSNFTKGSRKSPAEVKAYAAELANLVIPIVEGVDNDARRMSHDVDHHTAPVASAYVTAPKLRPSVISPPRSSSRISSAEPPSRIDSLMSVGSPRCTVSRLRKMWNVCPSTPLAGKNRHSGANVCGSHPDSSSASRIGARLDRLVLVDGAGRDLPSPCVGDEPVAIHQQHLPVAHDDRARRLRGMRTT